MRVNHIEAVPIINDSQEVVSIEFLYDDIIVSKFEDVIDVIIMAGGLGTRLYPYTKILPKPLIPIGEIPISEHIMDSFFSYGLNRFTLIVNHKKI